MIRKRGAGLQVQVYAGRDALTGGKRWVSRQVPGQTRESWKKAKQVEGELLAQVADGSYRGSRSMTVTKLVAEWLRWRETNDESLSPWTRYAYERLAERQITPAIGKRPITKLDVQQLDRFYAELRRRGGKCQHCWWRVSTGQPPLGPNDRYKPNPKRPKETEHTSDCRHGLPLSPSAVRDVHTVLSGALGLAVRWGYLPHNPAAIARPPARRKAPRKLPTPEQARELRAAAAVDDPEFELFLRLAAVTGLRRGEVCALRWPDFDLDASELAVTGSVLYLGARPIRKGPKSEHSERRLALDKPTIKLLRARHALALQGAEAAETTLKPDAYVFATTLDGSRPLRPDTMTRRFAKLAANLGHDYTLHGLRHFVATQLGAVATAATVRERLGHGSLEVTSTYTHRVPEADRAAATHMSKLLDGNKGRRSRRTPSKPAAF